MRARRWLGRLGLVLFGLGLGLGVAELALRVFGVERQRFAHPRHLENRDKTAAIDAYPTDPRQAFELDLRDPAVRARFTAQGVPELERVHSLLPHGVAFAYSSDRCRDREPPPRTEGVPRVLVIGDSFTEGQGVRADSVFARVLERGLADRHVEVFNCGRRGRDFPELHTYFPGLLAHHAPDVVLYAMLLNDPVKSEAFTAQQAYLNDWILDRRRMVWDAPVAPEPWWTPRVTTMASEAMEAIRVGRETTAWYEGMVSEPNAEGWRETQRLLRDMREQAEARHARFVVVLLPLLVGLDRGYPFARADAEIVRALGEAHIEVHAALPALAGRDPRTLWVHPVDMHPNEEAHALLGAFLVPHVRSALP